jgi:CP family cyanate transporter-like MFS transporter
VTAVPVSAPLPAAHSSRVKAGWLIVTAMVLTGLTMRVSVTSVGAVLTDLQHDLNVSSGMAGVLTTLPVLCFAAVGSLAPRLAHRFGEHRVVVAALALTTLGLATRAVANGVWLFAVLSLLALAGGAIANILMPTLVKRHFPERIGAMTAVYTTALAVGMTLAAGLTVPLANAAGGWRYGIGSWALLSAVAVLPWLATLRDDRPDHAPATARMSVKGLARSGLAWALTLMFAFQSLQAYIAFGWFTDYFRASGITAGTAGALVAFYAAISIPVSVVIPTLAVRGQRSLVAVMAIMSVGCYLGLLIAPVGGAWVWMLLGGGGSGMFPLALTMIGLRSRDIATTAALSAFVQSIGYLIAGTGPLLVGLLLDVTDSWTAPMVLLLVGAGIASGAAWYAGRDSYVDDEIALAPR